MKTLVVTVGGSSFEIELEALSHVDRDFEVFVDGQSVAVSLPAGFLNLDEVGWMLIDGRPYEIESDCDFRWIKTNKGYYATDIRERGDSIEATSARPRNGDGRIKAPIPGLITHVMVSEGDSVDAGQTLLILEAMKMENEIRTAHAGTIKALHVTPGKVVKLHEVLVEIN
jgi:biotin carboxyl carrier protein